MRKNLAALTAASLVGVGIAIPTASAVPAEPAPITVNKPEGASASEKDGSSAQGEGGQDTCLAAGLGAGLPLIALIPAALGAGKGHVENLNTQLQKTLGIYEGEEAARAAGQGLGMIVQGLSAFAAMGLGIFATVFLTKNCSGNSGSSAPTSTAAPTSSVTPSTTAAPVTSPESSPASTTTIATSEPAAPTTPPPPTFFHAIEDGHYVIPREDYWGAINPDFYVQRMPIGWGMKPEECSLTGYPTPVHFEYYGDTVHARFDKWDFVPTAGNKQLVDVTLKCRDITKHITLEHAVMLPQVSLPGVMAREAPSGRGYSAVRVELTLSPQSRVFIVDSMYYPVLEPSAQRKFVEFEEWVAADTVARRFVFVNENGEEIPADDGIGQAGRYYFAAGPGNVANVKLYYENGATEEFTAEIPWQKRAG